jgi:hypothetical protein
MTLRHAALSSLFVLLIAGCSDGTSEGVKGRGGAGGSGQSGGNGGAGKGGSNTAGSGGSNTGGTTGTGGSTGGNGGSNTGGTTGGGGTTGTGGSGTSGASGTGGSATGGASGSGGTGTGATAGTGGTGNGGTAGTGGAGSGGAAGTGGAGSGGTAGTGGAGGAVDAGGKGGTAGSSGTAGKDGGSGGGTIDAAPPPPVDGGPPDLPPPNGTCPDFVTGDVTFNPAGGARKVAITLGDASKTAGPLIVYWFATGSNPTEATRSGLPASAVAAAGGIIAAPYDVAGAGSFPWLSQVTQHYALFDEILACAAQKTKISPARVHSLGFSAGGLMTTQLSFARSKYLASVAAYSGGEQMGGTKFQENANKHAAMIMTGGTGDFAFIDFYVPSQTWQADFKAAGHFAMFCDHGGGHRIPSSTVVAGVFQFFMDHPYGANPSPYAGGKIPSAISICKE